MILTQRNTDEFDGIVRNELVAYGVLVRVASKRDTRARMLPGILSDFLEAARRHFRSDDN